MKSAGITDYDERSSQDSLNQGARPEDIVNWWKAKKSGAPMAPAPDDMSLLLSPEITMPDSLGDGSFDQQRYDTMQAQQRLRAKYTDANGVFTPPKSIFGDNAKALGQFAHLNSGRSDIGGQDINDPSKVIHDPIYGDFIDKRYLGQNAGDSTSGFMGQVGKYAPQAIGAVMSMASGGLMSPSLIQAAAAAGEGDWKGLGKIAPGLAMSVLGGQIGQSFLPKELTTGFNAAKPFISGAQSLYNAVNKPSVGSAAGAGLTLADIIKRYGMGG